MHMTYLDIVTYKNAYEQKTNKKHPILKLPHIQHIKQINSRPIHKQTHINRQKTISYGLKYLGYIDLEIETLTSTNEER
jgi:hypothetical protein